MSGDRWVDVGARDAAIRDAKRGCDCPRCEAIRFTKQQGDFAVAVEHDLRRRAEDQLADAQRTAAQAVARVRELEGEREEMLALGTPWPLIDVMRTLSHATDLLLGHFDYRETGWEEMRAAQDSGRAIVASLTASAGKETDRG